MQQSGHYRSFPGEHQRRAEDVFPQLAERTISRQQHQQVVSENRWRQHQRQRDGRIQYFFAAELAVRQNVSKPQAGDEGYGSGNERNTQAEPQREPVNLHGSFNYSSPAVTGGAIPRRRPERARGYRGLRRSRL